MTIAVLNELPPWRWVEDPAVVHWTRDRVLRVDGHGSRTWLNSLVTTDLRSSTPDLARYTLLLTPSGGIVSDAWVVDGGAGRPEGLALVLPAGLAERVHAQLERYLLNEDVSLRLDDDVQVVALQGPRARELVSGARASLFSVSCDRLGIGGIDIWVSTGEVQDAVDRLSASAYQLGGGGILAEDWAAGRIVLGVPLAGVDFDESTSPHEAGLEGRAVSFVKGCYVGQERVARQQRSGVLTRRLVQFEVETGEGSMHGSTVHDESGQPIGQITSAIATTSAHPGLFALGYVNPPQAVSGTQLSINGRPARVRRALGR